MGVFFRIAGITVGVFTLLRLATTGFDIEYKPFFQSFLDWTEQIAELGYLVDLIEKCIVHRILDWLRDFGLNIPDLQAYWRPVFTLTSLMLVSIGRNWHSAFGNPVATVALILYGGLIALTASVAVGTQPIESGAIVLWPGAAILTFLVLPLAIYVGISRRFFMFLFLAIVGAVAFPLLIPIKYNMWASWPNFLIFTIVVGAFGLFWLVGGVIMGVIRRVGVFNPATAIGLDVLSVLGLALGIGYIMME